MIVPTVITTDDDGKLHVFNLSQFVEFTDLGKDSVRLQMADGETHYFFDNNANEVKAAIVYLHNTFQEQAKAYELAKQQAQSKIVPANGVIQ